MISRLGILLSFVLPSLAYCQTSLLDTLPVNPNGPLNGFSDLDEALFTIDNGPRTENYKEIILLYPGKPAVSFFDAHCIRRTHSTLDAQTDTIIKLNAEQRNVIDSFVILFKDAATRETITNLNSNYQRHFTMTYKGVTSSFLIKSDYSLIDELLK